MIIYVDKITGCEVLTDAYPIEDKDGILKVKGKLTTMSNSIDESALGANPSAEEAAEGYDDSCQSGVDVVLYNKLAVTQLDKKGYIGCIKKYMKIIEAKLKESNPDRIEGFKKDMDNFVKGTVIGKYKEMKWEFYQGPEHYSKAGDEGMLILCSWDEEADIPYFYYFKDGLDAEKA